eukprot:1191577-Prymnesium_polylepis.2
MIIPTASVLKVSFINNGAGPASGLQWNQVLGTDPPEQGTLYNTTLENALHTHYKTPFEKSEWQTFVDVHKGKVHHLRMGHFVKSATGDTYFTPANPLILYMPMIGNTKPQVYKDIDQLLFLHPGGISPMCQWQHSPVVKKMAFQHAEDDNTI